MEETSMMNACPSRRGSLAQLDHAVLEIHCFLQLSFGRLFDELSRR